MILLFQQLIEQLSQKKKKINKDRGHSGSQSADQGSLEGLQELYWEPTKPTKPVFIRSEDLTCLFLFRSLIGIHISFMCKNLKQCFLLSFVLENTDVGFLVWGTFFGKFLMLTLCYVTYVNII